MAGGKTSPAKARLIARRHTAFALRKTGASLRAIADKIANDPKFDQPAYNAGQAGKDIKYVIDELKQQTLQDAEDWRQLQLEQLNMAMIAIADRVRKGDVLAIDRWLRILKQQSELLGLNLLPTDRPVQEELATGIELQLVTPEMVQADPESENDDDTDAGFNPPA